jgi:hypothetical protein
MMIIFPNVLNDESGLSEMSVVAWTISYDMDTCHHLYQGP